MPIIQKAIDDNHITEYYEPFVGGCNIIDKIQCEHRYGSDNNEYLIAFWQALQRGWNPTSVNMSKEVYTDIKANIDNYPKEVVALAGLCATYNAKWFGGYAGIVTTKIGTQRNYYDEAVRNIIKQLPNVQSVEFHYGDYADIRPYNSVVYCDPPYQGTTKYADEFDSEKYWDWVRVISKDNFVFCSEYSAPDDFECIWQKELITTLDKNSRSNATEKLFIHKYNSLNRI